MDDAMKPTTDPAKTAPAVPAELSESDLTGQVLGEFRILRRIGSGGMGEVYLAEQLSLKRKVALKLLNRDIATNDRSLQRFKAEAENVARATHANIVQIYTIGKTDGLNYIALEYVDGKNLHEFVEKKGTPELSLGLHIMAQVAAALQRASELGVIHRDVKPENIMLTKKGEVKVADFGLSRCFEESNKQNLTQSQVVMGTPLYMSPEQVERKTVDSRTDIYSFGGTSYYMFAGHPPFRGQSPIDVAYQHVHQEPPSLAEIRPDLPADLPRIIHKMMAKKPEERYQTAREVMRDINALRDSLNLGAIAAVSISSSFLGTAPDAQSKSATRSYPDGASRPKTAMRVLFVGSVLLALVGSVLFGWYQQQGPVRKDPADIVNVPQDDPPPARGLLTTQEREKELKNLVQKYAQPETQLDSHAALTHSVELALFYLKERKLEEADQFFKELGDPDRKIDGSRLLARLGHAMVLAFKDDYVESNRRFVDIIAAIEKVEGRVIVPGKKKDPVIPKGDFEANKLLWKDDWKLREMVARALNHNYANNPDEFPAKLDPYRFPPRPKLSQ